MVALIDGDMLCYRIGFACEHEKENVAHFTIHDFITDILMDLDKVESVEVFLTGKNNFRYDVAVTEPYKGNRSDKPKPKHLQSLRQYLIDEWDADVTDGQEADDSIAIRATELGGDVAIIVSLDKDFDQLTGWHYNFVKKDLYNVEQSDADLNFYSQFLTGDRVDNIIGVKGIGVVKAGKLLKDKTPYEMWQVCVEHLGEDRALENGKLLYLRRKPNEMWTPPNEKNKKKHTEGV